VRDQPRRSFCRDGAQAGSRQVQKKKTRRRFFRRPIPISEDLDQHLKKKEEVFFELLSCFLKVNLKFKRVRNFDKIFENSKKFFFKKLFFFLFYFYHKKGRQ